MSLADGALQLRLVNGDHGSVKDASDSQALEAVIQKGVNSDALYGGEATVFKETDDKALIRSVLEAFRPQGCTEW